MKWLNVLSQEVNTRYIDKLNIEVLVMKKTAVIVFEGFCLYEISVLLEVLVLNEKPVVFVANTLNSVRCEEKMKIVPDCTFDDIELDEFDSLVMTGSYAEGLYLNFKDSKLHELIRNAGKEGKLIAAISSGPMVLAKSGIMNNRKFYSATDRKWFLEDPNMKLVEEQMKYLIDHPTMKKMELEGIVIPDTCMDNNVLTAYGWKFREWAMEIAKCLNIQGYPSSFGLPREK